jgi:gliding motility-associated lipoprotein GldH
LKSLQRLHTRATSLFAGSLIISTLLLAGCSSIDAFEKNAEIPKHEWAYSFQPEVQFDITDTISPYNVLVTLRHTDAYAYKNIWLFLSTRQPGDSTFQKARFELTLQDQEGKWIGSTLPVI